MEILKTKYADIGAVLAVYDSAKRFMRENGNLAQWTNGYPDETAIMGDIQNGNSYVCMDGDQIGGVFSLIIGEDPTYRMIYEGQWLNNEPYGTIHRLAVGTHNKGVASFCLDWCFTKCGNIKADTHRDNLAMQNLLMKNGFSCCGIICLPDGSERLAYQKAII
jgi:hypothetical protein